MAKTSASERFVIGVDLGGTNIVVGAVAAADGRTLAVRSQATRSELGAESIVSRIGEMVDEVRAETSIDARAFLGVGVGAPGPLDRAKGVVIFAPNLGWRDMPLRDLVRQRTGLPTTLDNDANCATLGEWWCGAARGGRNVIGITIGTGIGGGMIIDGQLYHGASDVAGEVGHMSIDSQGRWCKCGNYGCLEAYTSGSAIATRARECLVADQDGSSPRRPCSTRPAAAMRLRSRSCATPRASSAPASPTCSTSSTPTWSWWPAA
jgi:glucokinase